MAIDVITPPSDINTAVDEFMGGNEKAILETLKYIGQKCEDAGKMGGSYKDQTGNLRASVRYRVIRDGEVIENSAPGNSLGAEKGDELLDKLAFAYSMDGDVLVVVAGMQYAAAVEAKGFNVITNSELLAEQLVPQLMAKFGEFK